MLVRLCLRQEDQLSIMKQDTAFVLFLHSAQPLSILTDLHQVAQQWNKVKSENPDQLEQPLRTILFGCVITAIQQRLDRLLKSEQAQQEAIRLGLVDSALEFRYMQWCGFRVKAKRFPKPYSL